MDGSFVPNEEGLRLAVRLLCSQAHDGGAVLPASLPESGMGETAALESLAPAILGLAARLGAPGSFAHMDPPTPWITWATALWVASLNQNLLHPATSPVARPIEELVVAWLTPFFGMDGGHMTPGSTVSNLTALWAARELRGVQQVAASMAAHVSIAKSAHLLGLAFRRLPAEADGQIRADAVTGDLSRTALVLTAGHTSTGVVDPLALAGRAAWTHVDAAWAGPLRLSPQFAPHLDGIEQADSVSVSAHKWLFQPKESALVFFRDTKAAHASISFGGAYLAAPNIGVLGSHGAAATPLMATLLALGRQGIAKRIERCVEAAGRLATFIARDQRLELFASPATGVVLWRPRGEDAERLAARLPAGLASLTTINRKSWIRNVAANPNADMDAIEAYIRNALAGS